MILIKTENFLGNLSFGILFFNFLWSFFQAAFSTPQEWSPPVGSTKYLFKEFDFSESLVIFFIKYLLKTPLFNKYLFIFFSLDIFLS